MGHERGAKAQRAEAIDGQENLILAASPGSSRVNVKREHRVNSQLSCSHARVSAALIVERGALRAERSFELPQLGELQEHVVRVERRDDEADRAVANAAVREVVAQERQRRMAGDLQQAGA